MFIYCAIEDSSFGRNLLDFLENEGYRARYHLRDFMPGALIDDNICQAVMTSKRTLCIRSSDFICSPYWMREFEVASFGNLVSGKKRLAHGRPAASGSRRRRDEPVAEAIYVKSHLSLLLREELPKSAALCHAGRQTGSKRFYDSHPQYFSLNENAKADDVQCVRDCESDFLLPPLNTDGCCHNL